MRCCQAGQLPLLNLCDLSQKSANDAAQKFTRFTMWYMASPVQPWCLMKVVIAGHAELFI
jgi:hypothetical protein